VLSVGKRLGVVLSLVLAFTIVRGAAVQPAGADGYCSRLALCMWEDARFSGSRYVFQNQPPAERCDGSVIYEIDGFNGDNEISSIDNATDFDVVVYADDGGQGQTLVVPSHQAFYGLGAFDNDAESFAFRC
jgi:peptidase inhibitor family I36